MMYCKHCGERIEWFWSYYQHTNTEQMQCEKYLFQVAEPTPDQSFEEGRLWAEYWRAMNAMNFIEVNQRATQIDFTLAYRQINAFNRFATTPAVDFEKELQG